MKARRAYFACLFLALAASPALAQTAAPAKPAGDPVVARVNGVALYRSDVTLAYGVLAADVRQKLTLQQAYPQLIDELISMTVVAQAAQKEKLDGGPLVKQKLALAREQILQDAYFNEILKKDISKDKLQAAYNQYAKDAPQHEEVNARHILVGTEQEAKDIIAQLKKGADFATLAKEKTTDPAGKVSGGDLGWFAEHDMVPEFAAAAFKLKKGEYTQTPVHTQFGWHVIKVEDRRQGKALSYDEVAPRLAQQMAQQIIAERVKTLDQQAKVEIFALDGSKLPSANQAPKLTPPGADGGAPGAPTLAPSTAPGGAPDKLNLKP
ncbi:MAG TPA: peptidylprolyl isomerase [Stellaceae bacterium]|nr:peptidylprolyl isomerase [Stellaceae bacterium]